MKRLFLACLCASAIGTISYAQSTTNSAPDTSADAKPSQPAPPTASYTPSGYYPGVNLSVAEFGKGSVLHKDYTYPSDNEFSYFHDKGFKVIRLPFKWERVQPDPMGDLDPENINEIDRCVKTATDLGMCIILDPHNYSRRKINGTAKILGVDPEVPNSMFDDLWTKLANRYKDNPRVWFGLINEPNKVPAPVNAATMQSAVNAIRATGAKNLILVPGTSYSGAHSWVKSGNAAAMENFKDPGDNFVFEVHQYLDKDSSGTHPQAVPGIGAKCLVAFTDWAKQHHFKALLGEFGWDGNPANTQANIEGDSLLSYMDQNKDVYIGYTYWAAGPWWNKYMYSVEPDGLKEGAPVDKNQMPILQKHQQ